MTVSARAFVEEEQEGLLCSLSSTLDLFFAFSCCLFLLFLPSLCFASFCVVFSLLCIACSLSFFPSFFVYVSIFPRQLFLSFAQEDLEMEVVVMLIDCCAMERTFQRFFALQAERLARLNPRYCSCLQEAFRRQYHTVGSQYWFTAFFSSSAVRFFRASVFVCFSLLSFFLSSRQLFFTPADRGGRELLSCL